MSSGFSCDFIYGNAGIDTNLLALDDPAMAQTVAIELRNSDRSRLALGEASPTEEVDANGNVTLNFFANYRALASGVGQVWRKRMRYL